MRPDVHDMARSVKRPGEEEVEFGEGFAKRVLSSSYIPNRVVEYVNWRRTAAESYTKSNMLGQLKVLHRRANTVANCS